ncbi:Hsp70 protein-domain-containing protein [Mycena vulgaris]|nr:Hsp70 protein-domain-containing protein [Mycena vulgaris]
MPLPSRPGQWLSCVPFLLGVVFYGWRYTLQAPVKWGDNGAVIGIEVGSVYARISLLVTKGRAEVLELGDLGRKLPSRVCFTGSDIIIGDAQTHPACDDVNFHVVRQLLDATVKSMGSEDRDEPRKEAPLITGNINGTMQTLNVTDIISMVLSNLVGRAEAFHGQPITHAILAVPTYFTETYRDILHDSARLANVTLLRVLTEPTATVIAYGLDNSPGDKQLLADEQRLLVLDVGVSVSAALLEIDNGVFEILARVRDLNSGGRALAKRIAHHAEATHIRVSGKGREGILGAAQMILLRVVIDVPTNDGTVLSVGLTRSEFVGISTDLFEDVMQCVEEVLLEANIILAGGSASTPRFSELLSTHFPGRTLLTSPNVRPDEAVVYGAALHARHFAIEEQDDFICCVDITPLTFGMEVPDGVFAVVLPRHPVIPNSKTGSFNLTEGEMRVFVGHGEHTNGTLGSLILPKPLGGEVQVRFEVDQADALTVSATNSFGRHVKFTAYRAELERYIEDHFHHRSAEMLVDVIAAADAWMAKHLYAVDAGALQERMMSTARLVRLAMRGLQLGIHLDDERGEL